MCITGRWKRSIDEEKKILRRDIRHARIDRHVVNKEIIIGAHRSIQEL